MLKILVPVDGSSNSLHAVRHVVCEFRKNPALKIHVLNVQAPFSRYISRFSSRRIREALHREQAEKALKPVRRLLESHCVPYTVHVEVGGKAEMIADTACRLQCDHVVMSAARKSSLAQMVEDSVTNQVLELTAVPVQIIAGDAISRWERYGIPAGLGAVAGLILLAAG